MNRALLVSLASATVLGCSSPGTVPEDWPLARTTSGTVELRLPSTYRKDGRSDQWLTDQRAPDARSLAVARTGTEATLPQRAGTDVLAPIDPWDIAPGDSTTATDVGRISERTRTVEVWHGQRLILETGRHSGVMGLPTANWVLRARLAVTAGDTIHVFGAAEDAAGLTELVTITRTVRPVDP